jgi:hypothetical protein
MFQAFMALKCGRSMKSGRAALAQRFVRFNGSTLGGETGDSSEQEVDGGEAVMEMEKEAGDSRGNQKVTSGGLRRREDPLVSIPGHAPSLILNETKKGLDAAKKEEEETLLKSAAQTKTQTQGGGGGLAESSRRSSNGGRGMPPLDWGNMTHPGPDGKKEQGMKGVFGRLYYSDEYKFGYLHQFKNGGSAIIETLNRLLCDAKGMKLEKACKMKQGDGSNLPDNRDYFLFTFSRNPWDRAVSMWSYGLKKQQEKLKTQAQRDKVAEKYCTFKQMLGLARQYLVTKTLPGGAKGYSAAERKCGGHWGDVQWRKQWDEKGIPLNFMGRLEHFERDWVHVLKSIDPSGGLYKLYVKNGFVMANDSGHKPYWEYYDEELKKLVGEIYRLDIERLGYTFRSERDALKIATYRDGNSAHQMGWGVHHAKVKAK